MSLVDISPPLTPDDLGLNPELFPTFRPNQLEMADLVIESENRFNPLCLPTGFGKSAMVVALAKASGCRTVILTANKGHQAQYMREHSCTGMVTIQGRDNYKCAKNIGLSCQTGALVGCELTGRDCPYEKARDVARRAWLVVTNYAYWLRINGHSAGLEMPPEGPEDEGGPPVELLILDEAHQADTELANFLQVSLKEVDLKLVGIHPPNRDNDVTSWNRLAHNHLRPIHDMLLAAQKKYKRTHHPKDGWWAGELDRIEQALLKVAEMQDDAWIVEESTNQRPREREYEFHCVWPALHNDRLFCGVPKVVLTSATLRPSTMTLLGLFQDDYEFTELPRTFPLNHTPIYFMRGPNVNEGMSDDDTSKWVALIDSIIETRLDRKGIIHTKSYPRQRILLQRSRFAHLFHYNIQRDPLHTVARTLERFKKAEAPAILVSPSFSTGWDFPYRTCEWQIVSKVPYLQPTRINKARCVKMPTYMAAKTAQELIQTVGRASRAEDDRCEIFIVDGALRGFLGYSRKLMPVWFRPQEPGCIPPPGPRCPAKEPPAPSDLPSLISTE